jgi:Domain of unknown function (DUF4826)
MSEERIDYDDPEVEAAWCDERRAIVVDYLRKQQVAHGRIGGSPAWHIAPYVSVWAIESGKTPDATGWWVISGDLPTDYLSGFEAHDPRKVVRAFGLRWQAAAREMSRGNEPLDMQIGNTPEERKHLSPMLMSRAELLIDFANRDEIWSGVVDD